MNVIDGRRETKLVKINFFFNIRCLMNAFQKNLKKMILKNWLEVGNVMWFAVFCNDSYIEQTTR